jgi:hypothetical protein
LRFPQTPFSNRTVACASHAATYAGLAGRKCGNRLLQFLRPITDPRIASLLTSTLLLLPKHCHSPRDAWAAAVSASRWARHPFAGALLAEGYGFIQQGGVLYQPPLCLLALGQRNRLTGFSAAQIRSIGAPFIALVCALFPSQGRHKPYSGLIPI